MRLEGQEWEQTFADLTEVLNRDAPFKEKADQALAIGTDVLGVEHGHLTRIYPDLDYWEVLASTDAPDGLFPSGTTADLQTTFCRRVIDDNATIRLHDAPTQGWENDIAYETHGIRCYLGTLFQPSPGATGTLCFVDEPARSKEFDDGEVAFAELLVSMLASEFQVQEQAFTLDRYTRLTEIFGRILRHNLRNDLTIIQGYIDLLIDQIEQPHTDSERLRQTLNRLITLAEKSGELRQIAQMAPHFDELSVTALLYENIAAVEEEYPAATFTLSGPDEVQLLAFPSLETAVYELLENVAKHAGTDPTCSITIESSADAVTIEIADNGSGLPEDEHRVLQGEPEKPLAHGSGVGLWIVWWIIDIHDGTIQTSVTPSGTSITVMIPRPLANSRFINRQQPTS